MKARFSRLFSVFSILAMLMGGMFYAKPAYAATTVQCGADVTHTSTQSILWSVASFNNAILTAEWSGYVKYTSPASHSCQMMIQYILSSQANVAVHPRHSTTDTSKAQWDPAACSILSDSGAYSEIRCYYTVPASTQQSNRVKLVTDSLTYPEPNRVSVHYYVYEWNGTNYVHYAADPEGTYYFN